MGIYYHILKNNQSFPKSVELFHSGIQVYPIMQLILLLLSLGKLFHPLRRVVYCKLAQVLEPE